MERSTKNDDPSVRRSTAPVRPGLRIRKKDGENEEKQSSAPTPSKLSSKAKADFWGLEAFVESPNQSQKSDTGTSSSSLSLSTPVEGEIGVGADAEEGTQTYTISVAPASAFSIFEFKPSCKVNVVDVVGMEISKDIVDSAGKSVLNQKKKESPDYQYKGPGGSVFEAKEKRELWERRRFGCLLSELPGRTKTHEKVYMELNSFQNDNEDGQYTTTNHSLKSQARGLSEQGGAYYVMTLGQDGNILAHAVKTWLDFTPTIKYKTLTCEEADRAFETRNDVLNMFSVMVEKRLKGESASDAALDNTQPKTCDEELNEPKRKRAKRREHVDEGDVLEWIDDSDLSSDSDGEKEKEAQERQERLEKKVAEEKRKVQPIKLRFPVPLYSDHTLNP